MTRSEYTEVTYNLSAREVESAIREWVAKHADNMPVPEKDLYINRQPDGGVLLVRRQRVY